VGLTEHGRHETITMTRLQSSSFIFAALFLLASCERRGSSADNSLARWYTAAQVEEGTELFRANCAVCHGANAEGTPSWFEQDANGKFPPPPLDGSAHAWHHPRADLQRVVKEGGAPFGGTMPAFGGTLSDEEIQAVIAYFQQQWPDDIYERWTKIDKAQSVSAE
jgi:mono/diheme cytochrome c family protein